MTHRAEGSAGGGPLSGCRVVVTRERRGELGRQLDEAGAEVLHVPLIEIIDAEPGDVEALRHRCERAVDWVVVTSAAGADRVGPLIRARSDVRVAAVGTATAERMEELVGRPVDLIPRRQTATQLAEDFSRLNSTPQDVLIAQADRAGSDLADDLRVAGHIVEVVTAYRTTVRRPSGDEIDALRNSHVVTFASGSAATGFAEALGQAAADTLPDTVVVIGPSTAAAAWKSGLKVTDIAADHSLAGLLDAVTLAWQHRQ